MPEPTMREELDAANTSLALELIEAMRQRDRAEADLDKERRFSESAVSQRKRTEAENAQLHEALIEARNMLDAVASQGLSAAKEVQAADTALELSDA